MLNKQLFIILVLISISIIPSFAQSDMSYSSAQVEVAPYMAFPLTEDIDYFGMSVGSQIKAGFTMPFIPALSLGPEAGYGINLLAGSQGDNLSTITAGVFARFSPYLAPWLTVNIFGNGGYYYSFLNNEPDQSGSNPYAGGGIGLSILFGKTKLFSVGVEGAYRNYLGFFQEIGVTASGTFHLGKKITPIDKTPLIIEPVKKLQVLPLKFENYTSEALFPTLLKYYNDHSFGSVEITNPNSFPLKNISVSYNIDRYMDNKKECISIPNLDAGKTVKVDLYALFNSSILDLYEKTMASAILQAEYRADNETIVEELPVTVDILDRNALIWDDDRRAAAFVTAKDPVVMKFAKNVISIVNISGAINTNLYRGIALFTALKNYGMIYSIDPASSYADFAESSMSVDYLQYPRQTLDYKSGDCDDLTVLNAALFESLGIPSAFVTIPGHIFLAFSLDIPYDKAGKIFINQEDLIDYNGIAWVPLEITQIKDGFLTAWDTAAREWKSAEANGQAGFFPVREAWNTYESVAFFENTDINFPEKNALHLAYQDEMQKFIGIQLAPRIASLNARLKTSSRPYRINNSLGVLFARYGRYEEAGLQFTEGLSLSPEFKPILTNMGNLQFIQKQFNLSLNYYKKAAEIDKDDAKVFISLALAYRELGEHSETLRNYNIAKELQPELADKYKFLAPGNSESGRAADTTVSVEDLIWDE